MERDIYKALTPDSQKKLCAWEEKLPETTYATYTTQPATGAFTLVAIAYNSDDSIYDTANFEASRDITAILDAVIMKSKSKTIEYPLEDETST